MHPPASGQWRRTRYGARWPYLDLVEKPGLLFITLFSIVHNCSTLSVIALPTLHPPPLPPVAMGTAFRQSSR
jgi:hypothetical protein